MQMVTMEDSPNPEVEKDSLTEISAEWKVFRFKDIVQETCLGTTSRARLGSDNIPLIKMGNLTFGGLDLSDLEYISLASLNGNNDIILKDGDFLFNTRNTPDLVGKCAVWHGECDRAVCDNNILIIRFKDGFSSDFICTELSSYAGKKRLKHIVDATTSVAAIYWKSLKNLKVACPSYPIQQKMVNIISSVDMAIGQTDAIIAQTERMKAGLMQVLLQGKDSTNGVPWHLVDLRTVCDHALNGGTPSTKIKKYWTGGIPWITGADIIGQKIGHIRRYITEEAVKDSSTHIIPKGNLLIVTRTGIGKLAIAPFDVAISQDITGFLPNKLATTKYLFWILNKHKLRLKKFDQGTSINGIKRDDLLSLKIPLPPISEQRKISSRLCAVNEKLELECKHRENLSILKNGLMQDLLTGRVPVKVDGHA